MCAMRAGRRSSFRSIYPRGRGQEYVEDCPVCCRPNVIHVEFEEDGEARVWGLASDDCVRTSRESRQHSYRGFQHRDTPTVRMRQPAAQC